MYTFYPKINSREEIWQGIFPPELRWLKDNYKEFIEYRWFNINGKTVEIHILTEDIAILYKLKFQNDRTTYTQI